MLGLKFDPKYTEAIILTFYDFPKPEKQQIERLPKTLEV